VLAMTHGRGADIVIDCVGMEPDRNILEKHPRSPTCSAAR
jgi:hypothetical protein